MHAVFDSTSLQKQKTQSTREKHLDDIRRWVGEQTALAVYLDNADLSPANADRQLGQIMFASDLEVRLKKLNPNLLFELNPYNRTKKALYHLRPGSGKTFICAYENGVMPEHSIMRVKQQDFIHPSMCNPATRKIDRKDLPRYKTTSPTDEKPLGTLEWSDPGALLPGMQRVALPWGEQTRGWRTVLIRLVQEHIVTPTEVEGIFGSDNRPEWAVRTGKKNLNLPW